MDNDRPTIKVDEAGNTLKESESLLTAIVTGRFLVFECAFVAVIVALHVSIAVGVPTRYPR